MLSHLARARQWQYKTAIAVMSIVVSCSTVSAQEMPVCAVSGPEDDSDTDGFAIENGETCLLPPENRINPVTSEPVVFERAYWLPEDVASQQTIACSFYLYDASENLFRNIRQIFHELNPPVDQSCASESPGSVCGGAGTIYTPDFNSYTEYTVEDGIFSWGAKWIDADFDISDADFPIDKGYQFWTADDQYGICSGIEPSGTAPQASPAICMDTIPVGDGWGWDGFASCRIDSPQPVAAQCLDSAPVGDGGGWDGVSSCQIPLEPTPVATCADTNPVGDGWGWNGSASCQIPVESITAAVCVDSDPVGDGWGWNGSTSCRIDNNASSACVDSDGDGWGWDGRSSCRI